MDISTVLLTAAPARSYISMFLSLCVSFLSAKIFYPPLFLIIFCIKFSIYSTSSEIVSLEAPLILKMLCLFSSIRPQAIPIVYAVSPLSPVSIQTLILAALKSLIQSAHLS